MLPVLERYDLLFLTGPPSSCLGSLAPSAPSAWTLGSVRHIPAPFEPSLIWEGVTSHQLPPHPNHQGLWPFPFRVCTEMYTCLIILPHVVVTVHLSYSFSLDYIFYLFSFNCYIVYVQYKFQMYNTVIHNFYRLYSTDSYCEMLAIFPMLYSISL